MPFIGLSLLIAIVAIVHVIKTGRSQLWIMVLLELPGLSAIAYFVVEVMPEFAGGRSGQRAKQTLSNTLTPNRSLEEAKREYSISNSVENACNLADIHAEKGNFAAAAELYAETLIGLNEHNPDILHKYAHTCFQMEKYPETRELLDRCIEQNPDYKNQDAHLLYAKTLHVIGETDKAAEEYETLITYFSGPEPAYHYGLLLKSQGSSSEAKAMFASIVDKSSQSPDHYRRLHREWIELARNELRSIS